LAQEKNERTGKHPQQIIQFSGVTEADTLILQDSLNVCATNSGLSKYFFVFRFFLPSRDLKFIADGAGLKLLK
jgi:hypothetical protein